MRRLILLRHGQTEWNAVERMQGQLDTDLTDLGRAQAQDAAEELSKRSPLAIVTSDLRRARDTAAALADRSGITPSEDPRLRETMLGEWQGLTHHEVDDRWPGARVAWRRDPRDAPPGGESRVDVARRSKPVVDELLANRSDWAEQPIVLVAHGGLIAALTAALLDLPVDNWSVFGGLSNTSWVQLAAHGAGAEPDWTLDVWNASARVASDVL